jgi:putative membrane protein
MTWKRLDPRIVVTSTAVVCAPLVPTLFVMLVTGAKATAILITTGVWVGIAALVLVLTGLRWFFTYYRITDDRFELREGNFSRTHRSIPRDRIRSVDLTADPVHRLFGLSVVTIGTGRRSRDEADLKLDSISRIDADQVRGLLLKLSTVDSAEAAGNAPVDGEIARLKPAWFGYAALTFSLVLAVWGALASAIGTFQDVLSSLGLFDDAVNEVTATPLWISLGVGALALLVIGVVGAVLLSVEMWWGFRLTRETAGTLRVRRGLLTSRSVSLEERRLRGIDITEPLLLRWAGGARVHAVATGLGAAAKDQKSDNKTLLPPAPRTEAKRVAAAVLREVRSPTDGAHLIAHPRAALRRRLARGATAAAAVMAAAATATAVSGVGAWWAVWTAGAVTAAVAAGFAVDAYGNLGHAMTPSYVITRYGSSIRRTVALQRSGIIGWRIKQSVFQRRSKLITVSATTAAGSGAYAIRDVTTEDGLAFAEETVPGLLAPFLHHD